MTQENGKDPQKKDGHQNWRALMSQLERLVLNICMLFVYVLLSGGY